MVEYAVLVSSLFQGDEENMCLNGTGVLRGECSFFDYHHPSPNPIN